jgi:hypothetical protein
VINTLIRDVSVNTLFLKTDRFSSGSSDLSCRIQNTAVTAIIIFFFILIPPRVLTVEKARVEVLVPALKKRTMERDFNLKKNPKLLVLGFQL